MPEDHPYRKTPSVADLMRKRAADEASHAADRAARDAARQVVERWNAERSPGNAAPHADQRQNGTGDREPSAPGKCVAEGEWSTPPTLHSISALRPFKPGKFAARQRAKGSALWYRQRAGTLSVQK
jgi:hypothetical protein